jgi:hypothetical protein
MAASSVEHSDSPTSPSPAFDMVLRGYHRDQVDDRVAHLSAEISRLKDEIAEVRRTSQSTSERTESTERELHELRATSEQSEQRSLEDSFGYRAEKLLYSAERDAAEMRSNASQESAAIIEQARTDAERHRHEVEQSLIARAAVLERQAAQRAAELLDREQQISDQLSVAREQAGQLHASATRTADRLRQESEAAAEEARVRAAADLQRQRNQAEQEIARLEKVRVDVRAEIARLTDMLANELGPSRPVPSHQEGEAGNGSGSDTAAADDQRTADDGAEPTGG